MAEGIYESHLNTNMRRKPGTAPRRRAELLRCGGGLFFLPGSGGDAEEKIKNEIELHLKYLYKIYCNLISYVLLYRSKRLYTKKN